MQAAPASLPSNPVAHDPHEKPDRYDAASRGPRPFAIMKEIWRSQSQRSRWLKTAIVASLLLLAFYWLSPHGVDVYSRRSHPSYRGQVQASLDSAATSGGTKRCTKPFSKDKSLIQYVLMIDAGSTGSRIHVYKFNNCGPVPELESEEFKMTEKSVGGLSAFKDDPVAAAKSLDPLMQVAMEHVPDKLKGCSPVAVKATAGLRLIGAEKSQAILNQVRRHLEQDYPFPVVSEEQGGVAVMDGADEGVYAWITTNYLLGKIGGPEKEETAAVFDLGGGSTQIVFEPSFKTCLPNGKKEKLADGDHKYELDFGGQKFQLYQHSHLGFGLMSARKSIHKALITEMARSRQADSSWMSKPVVHPCIAPGTSKAIEVEIDDQKTVRTFNFTGPSRPAPAQCRNLAERILNKDAVCKLPPCSFNGIHQPALAKTFPKADVFIFSYFFDRTKPLGMPDSFTVQEMQDLTQKVCKGEDEWDVFGTVDGALEELRNRPEHCLDLNFMLALLHTGYEMSMDREVKIAKKIKGNELGWCLGASLPLLAPSSGWKCKIREIP